MIVFALVGALPGGDLGRRAYVQERKRLRTTPQELDLVVNLKTMQQTKYTDQIVLSTADGKLSHVCLDPLDRAY
jgi:hypothetical protein